MQRCYEVDVGLVLPEYISASLPLWSLYRYSYSIAPLMIIGAAFRWRRRQDNQLSTALPMSPRLMLDSCHECKIMKTAKVLKATVVDGVVGEKCQDWMATTEAGDNGASERSPGLPNCRAAGSWLASRHNSTTIVLKAHSLRKCSRCL